MWDEHGLLELGWPRLSSHVSTICMRTSQDWWLFFSFFSSLEKKILLADCTIVSIGGRLPGGPVGPDGSRSQPLAVHERDRVLGLHLLGERDKAVALGLERLRIANHTTVTKKKKEDMTLVLKQ